MFVCKGGTCEFQKWPTKGNGEPTDVKLTVEKLLEDIKEALDERDAILQSFSTSNEQVKSLSLQLQQLLTTPPAVSSD